MPFTIICCDIELKHYLQILVNKHEKNAQVMLGVLDMLTKITFPILLINKPIFLGGKTILNLNFEVVFLTNYKTCI